MLTPEAFLGQLSTSAFAPGLNLRTVLKDGEPWFVLVDVCDVLELAAHQKGGYGHHVKDLDADEFTPFSNWG